MWMFAVHDSDSLLGADIFDLVLSVIYVTISLQENINHYNILYPLFTHNNQTLNCDKPT